MLLLAVGQQAAMAADYSFQVVGTGGIGVCRRVSPQLGAQRDGCVPEGNSVTVNCWVSGETVTDTWQGRTISWNHWARTPDGRYIADIYLNSGANSYPQCAAPAAPTASRESRAVDFARSQVASPSSGYDGYCELLVENAYGTSLRYPSALADYQAQRAAGLIHADANPPAGALVFYSYSNLGHVGLSLGGGQAVSSYTTAPYVRQHGVTARGLPYLGWSPAPVSWPGR